MSNYLPRVPRGPDEEEQDLTPSSGRIRLPSSPVPPDSTERSEVRAPTKPQPPIIRNPLAVDDAAIDAAFEEMID
jgi:hypothetical protein